MYKPCWRAKGGIIDMGNGRIAKINFNHFSSLELVLYSWGILDFISGRLIAVMAQWMASLNHTFTRGFCNSSHQEVVSVSHCLNLSCLVTCFGQKNVAEVTLYPHLKRSFCFHCFSEACHFHENKPSPPFWRMKQVSQCSPLHLLGCNWPPDTWGHPRPANPHVTCQLSTDTWWSPAKLRPWWPFSWVNKYLLF